MYRKAGGLVGFYYPVLLQAGQAEAKKLVAAADDKIVAADERRTSMYAGSAAGGQHNGAVNKLLLPEYLNGMLRYGPVRFIFSGDNFVVVQGGTVRPGNIGTIITELYDEVVMYQADHGVF